MCVKIFFPGVDTVPNKFKMSLSWWYRLNGHKTIPTQKWRMKAFWRKLHTVWKWEKNEQAVNHTSKKSNRVVLDCKHPAMPKMSTVQCWWKVCRLLQVRQYQALGHSPVYVVEPLQIPGNRCVLHQNLLLQCPYLVKEPEVCESNLGERSITRGHANQPLNAEANEFCPRSETPRDKHEVAFTSEERSGEGHMWRGGMLWRKRENLQLWTVRMGRVEAWRGRPKRVWQPWHVYTLQQLETCPVSAREPPGTSHDLPTRSLSLYPLYQEYRFSHTHGKVEPGRMKLPNWRRRPVCSRGQHLEGLPGRRIPISQQTLTRNPNKEVQ